MSEDAPDGADATVGDTAPSSAGSRLGPVIRGFLALGVATAVGQLIGFAVLVLVARRAGPENLGAYSFAQSFAAIFEIPIDFGVTMYAIREVARRPERLRAVLGEVIVVQALLLVASLAVTLTAAIFLLPSGAAREVLPIVLAGWIPTALSLDWAMRALQDMRTVAVWRLAGQVVYGALAPLLIGSGLTAVKTYAWLNVLGAAVTAIGISVMLLRAHGRPRMRVDVRALGRRYARGAIVGISLAIVMIYYQIDVLLLGYLREEEEVGLFGVAYRIPSNIVLIGTIWLQAAYPYASALVAREPLVYLAQLGRVLSVSIALALPIGVGGSIVADDLVVGLFGSRYAAAGTALALLTWSAALALVQVHLSNAVLALGQDRRYLVGVSVAAVVNGVLALTLIPPLGATGAALATIGAEAALGAMMLDRVMRLLGPPRLEWRRVFASVAASAVMAAVLLLLRSHVSVWLCLATGVVVYAVGAVAFGVFGIDELRRLARRQHDAPPVS